MVRRALAAISRRRPPVRARPDPTGIAPSDDIADTVPPDAPEGADWVWRPVGLRMPMRRPGHAGVQSGTVICDGLTLYHDCPSNEIVLRQHPQVSSARAAPHGLSVETFHFGGSYLSFALTLPPAALRNLTLDHLLAVQARLSISPPGDLYVRLNLRHGPNTAQVTRQAPFAATEVRADFDFRTVAFRPDRLSEIWVDLILDRPEMTRCMIEDIVVSRRLRAIL